MRPRVILADDHQVVIEGLRGIIEPEFEVVASATDGLSLVELTRRLEPDVVVTDISMPLLDGIEAARRIKKVRPQTKIVFLTMHFDVAYAEAAFAAGGSGYVLKQSSGSDLVRVIHTSLAGGSYVSPLVDAQALNTLQRAGRRSGGILSPRQRQVLQLIADGKSAKEIAAQIGISPRTVEFHKQAMMSKLGLRTTSDLLRYAIRHGFAE